MTMTDDILKRWIALYFTKWRKDKREPTPQEAFEAGYMVAMADALGGKFTKEGLDSLATVVPLLEST